MGEERGTGKYGLAWCGQDSSGVGEAAAYPSVDRKRRE